MNGTALIRSYCGYHLANYGRIYTDLLWLIFKFFDPTLICFETYIKETALPIRMRMLWQHGYSRSFFPSLPHRLQGHSFFGHLPSLAPLDFRQIREVIFWKHWNYKFKFRVLITSQGDNVYLVLLKNKTKVTYIILEITVKFDVKRKIILSEGVKNRFLITKISYFFNKKQKEILGAGLAYAFRICQYFMRTLDVKEDFGYVACLISNYIGYRNIHYLYNVSIVVKVNLLSIHQQVFLKKASKTASKKYQSKPENYVKKRKKPKYKFHRW